MRIRNVKPDYWRDRLISELPDAVARFYIGLWMEADDAGWLRWEPEEIAADLYPYRPVRARERQVREWGAMLEERGRLEMHACGHAFIPTLVRHQRFGGKVAHTVKNEHGRCVSPPPSAEVRESPRASVTGGEGRGGYGREGEGSRAGAREEASSSEAARESIAADLRKLWRRDATDGQLRILDEIADRQRSTDRSGWTWIAETMAARPDGADPLEFVKAEDRRLSDERLARADADEAAWNEAKRDRDRTAGVPPGRRLAQDPETKAWTEAEEATG